MHDSITLPCSKIYEGGTIIVEGKDGSYKRILVPPFYTVDGIRDDSFTPIVTVKRIFTSTGLCMYEITVVTRYESPHVVMLFEGELSQSQLINFEDFWYRGPRWDSWIPKKGPITLLENRTVQPGVQTTRFVKEGPGTYTVVVATGSCMFAFPAKLPPCISISGDPDRYREKFPIKWDGPVEGFPKVVDDGSNPKQFNDIKIVDVDANVPMQQFNRAMALTNVVGDLKSTSDSTQAIELAVFNSLNP